MMFSLDLVNQALIALNPPPSPSPPVSTHIPPPDLINPKTNPYNIRVFARSLQPNPPTHLLFAKPCSRPEDPINDPQNLTICDSHPNDSPVFFGQKVQIQVTDVVRDAMVYNPNTLTIKGWVIGIKSLGSSTHVYVVAGTIKNNLHIAFLEVPRHRNERNFPIEHTTQTGKHATTFFKIEDIPAYLSITNSELNPDPSANERLRRLMTKITEIRESTKGTLYKEDRPFLSSLQSGRISLTTRLAGEKN